ncbi:MAG TPA: MFS transporter [Polyangiaceae bacterium]|nr:MFS transporter [Polyangiaceae bacterium]
MTTHAPSSALWRDLAPICSIVFFEFLAMGLPLAVLPVHVQGTLGFGSFVVGVAIGSQSWATLLTRHAAGKRADQRGPRAAARLGLMLSALAGAAYALSHAISAPSVALMVLMVGRALLGAGESLVITGALSWGVALAGRERSGIVMAWVGVAMYGALAVGAPLGSSLAERFGFVAMCAAAALSPVLALAAVRRARSVEPVGGARLPFYRVVRLIALPGSGLALSALSFGAIAAFSTLLFAERSWPHAAAALSAFGAAYVLARLLFGGLPDRFGGARIAIGSAALAALGQLGVWLATSGPMAVVATALTGFGFSLAFPAFGVEAIRRVPPQNRGVALGAYAACFDVSLGLGVPLLGGVVALGGNAAAFGAAGFAALLSLLVGIALWSSAKRSVA